VKEQEQKKGIILDTFRPKMVFDSVYFFLKLMFFRGNPTAVLSVLFLFLAALAGWIIEHKYSGALKYAAVYFCVFYIFVWAYIALRAEKTSYNIYREGIGHTCVFFEKTDKYEERMGTAELKECILDWVIEEVNDGFDFDGEEE